MAKQKLKPVEVLLGEVVRDLTAAGTKAKSFARRRIQEVIDMAVGEVEWKIAAAFGGCELCYGKGYASVVGNPLYEHKISFCKCSRGEQLRKIFSMLQ